MSCFEGLVLSVPAAAVGALWIASAIVLLWVLANNRFAGKPAFVLTFSAMLWWLFTVAMELASQGLACKVAWSLAAWPGIALLPVAWTFFVFDYTMNTNRGRKPLRLLSYVGLPAAVGLIALTNAHTQLLYGPDTRLVGSGANAFVIFDHGPFFFMIAAALYVFVGTALGVLGFAFVKARMRVKPFIAVLVIVTAAPLAANAGYIVWGVTVAGHDPTPFMFALALIAFSWLLLNNTMLDTVTQGRNLMFYATGDPVLITDAGGLFAGANAAARALFGPELPRQGASLAALDRVGPLVAGLVASGRLTQDGPLRFGGQVYDPRAYEIESPIRTEDNRLGWAVALVDITERERSAEALREALERAEAANRAKSQFLAMISHELRTPLTSVKGGLELALHGSAGEVSEPVRKLLTIAQRNSVRLLKLIEDVLDLQKLDLNAVTLDLERVDAERFMADTLEEYQAQAASAGVSLALCCEGVAQPILADPQRLKQVVGNVLSNAVRFSRAGGVVDCILEERGAAVRLSIRDHGIGIPAGAEDRVFGRFEQVDNSSDYAAGGSGLGMHIARLLIERMGGAISYESFLGAGTTFFIEIPLAPARAGAGAGEGRADAGRTGEGCVAAR